MSKPEKVPQADVSAGSLELSEELEDLGLEEKAHLTRRLISVQHYDSLILKMESEIYERVLPVTGKLNGEIETSLIDCRDLRGKEDATLILTTVIKSALERAEPPLEGRIFMFRAGAIREGKRYRDVDVVELGESAR